MGCQYFGPDLLSRYRHPTEIHYWLSRAILFEAKCLAPNFVYLSTVVDVRFPTLTADCGFVSGQRMCRLLQGSWEQHLYYHSSPLVGQSHLFLCSCPPGMQYNLQLVVRTKWWVFSGVAAGAVLQEAQQGMCSHLAWGALMIFSPINVWKKDLICGGRGKKSLFGGCQLGR